MNKIRISLCQLKVTNNKKDNLIHALNAIDKASINTNLVCLPECFNCPYDVKAFPEYAEIIPDNLGYLDPENSPSVAMLSNASKKYNIFLIGGSIPEKDSDNLIYNTCMVFSPQGEIIAKYRKIHLFDIDIPNKISFKESETLTSGNEIVTFDMPQGKVGIGICFDIRFPEQSRQMRDLGCKLLVFPGAFNMTTGPAHWELLQRGRAIDNQLYFCTVSPARNLDALYYAWGIQV